MKMNTINQSNSNLITGIDNVDNSSLAEKVEVILVKYFLDNKLKPGDAIPKEIDLAASIGVSRTVIREALTRLRMTGLIESKKKRGSVLANPDLLSLLQKTIYPDMMNAETLRDMFEMRLVMEIGMADLIFQRITKKDIDDLMDIVKVEPPKTDKYLFDIEQEIEFHGKLYDIAGNETLKRFQQMLLPVFKYVHESGILAKKVKGKRHVSHKGIVEVIKTGTPEELRNAMRSHFENHFQRLF